MRKGSCILACLALTLLALGARSALAAGAADAQKHYEAAEKMAEKNPAGAIADLEKALEDDPNHVPSYLALAELYLGYKKDAKTALTYVEKAEAIAPNDAKVQRAKGNILLTLGGKENAVKAEAAYRKAIELEPENPDGHILLGRVLLLLGKKDEGLAEYDEALRLKPDNPLWLVEYGRILIGLKDYAKAEDLFKRAIKLRDDYIGAHWGLADLYALQKHYDDALREYQVCLSLQANNYVVMGNIGWCHAQKKDYRLAASWYKQALGVNPQYTLGWYSLACVYALQGDETRAVEALRQAIQLNPGLKEEAKAEPDFKSLRGVKEFQDLVAA